MASAVRAPGRVVSTMGIDAEDIVGGCARRDLPRVTIDVVTPFDFCRLRQFIDTRPATGNRPVIALDGGDHDRRWPEVRSVKRQRYKDHMIETRAMKLATGWGVKVSIMRDDGALAVKDLDIGDAVTFATSDLADNAGILLGRAWIDRRLQA